MKGNNRGITLIALVVTIIVLLILAAVSIRLLLGDNGILTKSSFAAFAEEMSSVEEQVILARGAEQTDAIVNGTEDTITISEDGIFVAKYNDEQITDKLKRDIVELRENNRNSGMSQEEINAKYDALKNAEGNIDGLLYINKKYAKGKDRTYLFDTKTSTVIKVPGKIIGGEEYHIYKWNTGISLNITKPEGADLSEHKPLEEGWIPIYTIENYKKVATEEQNYDIYDLKGTKIGTYNMNKDAKYRMMNDIDFEEETVDSIKGFKGTFDGNGYYISNIKIDNTNNTETYYYYSQDNMMTSEFATTTRIGVPTGLFDRIETGRVENLGIDNANVEGNIKSQTGYASNVGILAGEVIGTTIENCIIKNSFATSDGARWYGPVGVLVGWVYESETLTNIKKINVDNTEIIGSNITSGLVAVITGNIYIENCLVENSTIHMEAKDKSSSDAAQAGILGHSYAEEHSIKNCYVGNTIFTNNMEKYACTSSAGIFGGMYSSYVNGSSVKQDINIENCIVENCEFPMTYNGAGICGNTGYSNNDHGNTLNITNCTVSNVKLNSATSGGILGYSVAKNINIKNCNVNKLETEENTHRDTFSSAINRAGIVGCLYYSQNVNVISCNVLESTIVSYDTKDQMTNTSGIIATIYGSRELKRDSSIVQDCNVSNSTIKTKIDGSITKSSTSGCCKATGIIGTSSGITIDNCNVNDSYIICESENQYTGTTSTGDIYNGYVAGIVGDNSLGNYSGDDKLYVKNCKISKTEITSDYGSAYGIHGAIQWSSGNNYIIDCDIKDSLIKGRCSTAGVTNYASASTVTIDSCDMINCDIISEERNVAGIMNMGSYNNTIKNCTVVGCNIENEKYVKYNTYSTSSFGDYGNAGGIVSYCSMANIENCTVKDTKIDNKYQNTGGILGINWGNTSNITGCKVENVTIISEKQNTGAIVGMGSRETIIKDCHVIGGTITTKGVNVGGIQGYCNWSSVSTIEDCTVKGLEINSEEGIAGGIIGFAGYTTLKNIDAENIKVSTKGPFTGGITGMYCGDAKGIITNCNVKSSVITSDNYGVGGLIGNKNDAGDIDSCTVVSTQISGKDSAVGGLVGYHIGSGIINNSMVKDSKVTITGADAKGVGGIVGYGSNITYVAYSKTYDTKNTITNCKVLGTEITGIDYVGGISGVASVVIDGCIVDEKTNIKGTNCVGGIQGFGGILGQTPITYDYTTYAYTSGLYAMAWKEGTREPITWYTSTISNCQVNNTTITGTTDAQCFEGKESYYTNGYVGSQSQDKIINCTNKNVTINGVLREHIHTSACYHTHIGEHSTQAGCYTGDSYTATAGVYNVEGWEEEVYYRAYYYCAGCGTKIKMWYEGQVDPNTGVITEIYKKIEPGLRGCCTITAYKLNCEYKDYEDGKALTCGYPE